MAALIVNTEAIVLLKRPSTSDSFQTFGVFSEEHGGMLVLQRISKGSGKGGKGGRDGSGGGGTPLDLFSEMSLALESSNQGRTWFVKEARLVKGAEGIGSDYETLRRASEFAALIARNTVASESRARVYALLRQAFAAFAGEGQSGREGRERRVALAGQGGRKAMAPLATLATLSDIIYIKAVYRFARDEGYPLKEQWFASLAPAERGQVAALINKPLAEQTAPPPPETVDILRKKLEAYLRAQTEILME